MDGGVVEWSTCRYPTARRRQNVEVRGSHLGMASNPAVLWLLADRLGGDGTTWTPFRPPLPLRRLRPATTSTSRSCAARRPASS